MKKNTHYFSTTKAASYHLTSLLSDNKNVIMLTPDFTEQGLYTFIIE